MSEFSFNTIEEVTGNNKGFMLSLLKAIDKAFDDYPVKMNEQLEAKDIKELGRVAHKFKSSVAYISYLELDDILSNIELADNDNLTFEQVELFMTQLTPVVEFVHLQVKDKIHELS